MTILKKDWPRWASIALQGVVYWIGHRRCLYNKHPLTEGALVAEICNLIYANLDDPQTLHCEVMYTKLLPGKPRLSELTQRARADLVVVDGDKLDKGGDSARFIIEVKRASAPKTQIDSDLRRLASVRRLHPTARTFMFLISEAERPDRFVNDEGNSRRGRYDIPKSKGYFRVRRTLKAAHAYTKKGKAQYACLIEVYY